MNPMRPCTPAWSEFVFECLYRGTEHAPYQLSRAEAAEIRGWLAFLEKQLELLPKAEQPAFIEACRKIAKERWPWWRPNIVVEIVP